MSGRLPSSSLECVAGVEDCLPVRSERLQWRNAFQSVVKGWSVEDRLPLKSQRLPSSLEQRAGVEAGQNGKLSAYSRVNGDLIEAEEDVNGRQAPTMLLPIRFSQSQHGWGHVQNLFLFNTLPYASVVAVYH